MSASIYVATLQKPPPCALCGGKGDVMVEIKAPKQTAHKTKSNGASNGALALMVSQPGAVINTGKSKAACFACGGSGGVMPNKPFIVMSVDPGSWFTARDVATRHFGVEPELLVVEMVELDRVSPDKRKAGISYLSSVPSPELQLRWDGSDFVGGGSMGGRRLYFRKRPDDHWRHIEEYAP